MMMEQCHHDDRSKFKLCLAVLCGLPGAGKTSLSMSLREMEHPVTAVSSKGHLDDEVAVDTTVLHLCYDDIIPRQLEMEGYTSKDDADFAQKTSLSSVSPWKAYRQEILHCTDWVLGRFKTIDDTSDIAMVFDESQMHVVHQELSDIGTKVRRKMLSLFQDQLGMSSSQRREPVSVASPHDRRKPLASSVILVIDDNMYYRSMRYEYYQLARKHGAGICQLYLRCSTEVAVARNSERGNDIPMETILKMADRMEVPDAQVAPWEMYCMHINAETIHQVNTISSVWNLIMEALLNPVSPSEEEKCEEKEVCRAVCAASTIHQADQSLRKCVAKAMAAAKEEGSLTKVELRAQASKLNSVRQDVLQGIRDGRIRPPPLVATETNHSESTFICSDFDRFMQTLFEKEQIGS